MNRFVRVVLSASVEQFNRSIQGARRLFRDFQGSIVDGAVGAVRALTELGRALFFLREGLRTVIALAKGLFDTFLQGAIDAERQQIAFEVLTDDAEKAADMMAFLREEANRTGNDFDGLTQSGQQLAVALRGVHGEVDAAVWEDLVRQVEAFQALKPEVPIQLWGRAISAFLAGDPSTLTRLLDVNVKQLGQLSEEARQFLTTAGAAGDQQLGTVTRLAGGVEADMETALSALNEVAEAVGATDELTERLADTTGGKLAQSQEIWKDTLRDIGEKWLPVINQGLDQLLKFLESDEFSKLADAFADFGAEGLEELLRLLEETDPSQVGEVLSTMADALGQVNWEAIASAVRELNQFLTTPVESPILDFLNNSQQGNTQFGEDVGQFFGTGGRGGGFFGEGGVVDKVQQGTRGMLGLPEGGLQLGPTAPQKVEVEITFDEDAAPQLRRVAQRAAQRELGEFIDGVTSE